MTSRTALFFCVVAFLTAAALQASDPVRRKLTFFAYSGAQHAAGAELFPDRVRLKLIQLAGPANLEFVEVDTHPETLPPSPDARLLYWRNNNSLFLVGGGASAGERGSVVMQNEIFLGDLRGSLDPVVLLDVPFRAETYATSKDSLSVLALFVLGKEYARSPAAGDRYTARSLLSKAQTLLIDLGRRRKNDALVKKIAAAVASELAGL